MHSQVILDVVRLVKALAQADGSRGEAGPVDTVGQFVVIELADLEQVHEGVCLEDDLDGAVGVQHGLQADPGRNTGLVECVQGVDAFAGQRGARLPFARVLVREQRHRRGIGIALGEQVEVGQRAQAALREDLHVVPVGVQRADDLAGKPVPGIGGLVGVGREREQDALAAAGRLTAVGLQFTDEAGPWVGIGVERGAGLRGELVGRDGRDVAVAASVRAAAVMVNGEWGVFTSAALGDVQN